MQFQRSADSGRSQWLVAAFLSGFSLLALEVIWFRFLLLFVKGHSNAFPVMLGVVLAGIALGGLAASLWLRLVPEAHRFAAPLAFVAGVATVVSYAAFPSVMAPFGLSSITRPAAILRVGVPLMLPVSFVSGMFFPLVGAALRAVAPLRNRNRRRPHACQHPRRRTRLARRRVHPAAARRHREVVLHRSR